MRGGSSRLATIRPQRRGLRLPSCISARLDLHAEGVGNSAVTEVWGTRAAAPEHCRAAAQRAAPRRRSQSSANVSVLDERCRTLASLRRRYGRIHNLRQVVLLRHSPGAPPERLGCSCGRGARNVSDNSLSGRSSRARHRPVGDGRVLQRYSMLPSGVGLQDREFSEVDEQRYLPSMRTLLSTDLRSDNRSFFKFHRAHEWCTRSSELSACAGSVLCFRALERLQQSSHLRSVNEFTRSAATDAWSQSFRR